MNSHFTCCIAAIMLATLMTTKVTAQDPTNSTDSTLQLTSETSQPEAPIVANGYSNDISSRAVRDFGKWFPDATSEQWYKTGDDFAVYFEKAGIKYKVAYDKKGNRQYVMSSYLAKDFISSEKNRLKNIFYDYNTLQVLEIRYAGQLPLYLVRMEKKNDQSIIKTIRLYKDDIKEAKLHNGEWITTDDY